MSRNGLSIRDVWTLALAYVQLPLMALALRWFGLQRVSRYMFKGTPADDRFGPADDRAWHEVGRARWAVETAWRWHLWPATCLHRSLVLCGLLRRRGVPARLRIGVRKFPLYVHAWVELADIVINDSQEVKATHVPIDTDVGPDRQRPLTYRAGV